MSQSAVQFANDRRVHLGLAVANVDRSREFYQAVFDAAPTKTRAGYARFEVVEPPLNLSIVQSKTATGPADPVSHFGIQVKSTTAVVEMQRRLESVGIDVKLEDSVNCCHAVQDKAWITDPDGHRWEVFVVLDDAPAAMSTATGDCCTAEVGETCCPTGGDTCC